MSQEERLAKVRGEAPEKRPTVSVLARATAHSDCTCARVALASRTDLDKLCDGTYFAVDFGQDPQTFLRGEMFERRVKEKDYAALIQLLRESAGFAITDARIRNLKSSAPPNEQGLRQRATETRQLLKKMVTGAADAPNIVDGAVLTCRIADRTAYFEADGLAAATSRKIHVAEVKSFPFTDGRCDNDKLGAACEQAAWYALLCRRELVELGLSPSAVSEEGFIILARGLGLTPTLLKCNLGNRIVRAEQLLNSAQVDEDLLQIIGDMRFPGADDDAQLRIDALEHLMDKVGTRYRPECLQDCGAARLCRARAQAAGLATVCGSPIVRLLPGVRTLDRAAELALGGKPAPIERHAASALQQANVVYDRVLKLGVL
jgi:hypothetical protein